MDQFLRDLRLGFRTLRKNAGFTTAATLTLALGIGVSTALFSVVYGVWLNAYPYTRADEILYPRARANDGGFADSQNGVFLQREFQEMAKLPAVAAAAAFTLGDSVTLVGEHGPELVPAFFVSGSTTSFLGARALLGRPIQPSDIRAGGDGEAVAVLSFNLWQRMFGGAADVVGRTVSLSGVPHLIIGVMPRRFGWGSASLPTNDGLWLPLPTTRSTARLRAWVRLGDGVSQEVAVAQFQALFVELAKARPGSFPPRDFETTFRQFSGGTGETRAYVEQMRASLRLLLFAVGFLLIIACTNVANLQLARSSTRAREFAIRLAIGGSRGGVFRQLLVENLVLAAAAGVVGVGLAVALTRLIAFLIPRGYVPSESAIAINMPVLLVGVGLSIVSGLLFGLLPAIHGSNTPLNDTLKDTGLGSGGRKGARTRSVLVVVQVGLSIILMTGATLAARGYIMLGTSDPGFNPQRLFEVAMRFQGAGTNLAALTTARNGFLRDLPDRVRRVPSIESAAIGATIQTRGYQVAGQASRPTTQFLVHTVGADYLRTRGMTLRAGRDLSATDIAAGEPVALINDAARQFWPAGAEPVGGRIALPGLRGPNDPAIEATVVGIIASGIDTPPAIVLPYTIAGLPGRVPTLSVRTRHDDPLRSANAVRAQAFALNPNALLLRPVDLADQVASGRQQPRFNIALFGCLAAFALILSAAGIYAVLSYQVARARREMGIRLALGAGRWRIVSMVFRSGALLTGTGLALGVAGSVAISRFVKSQVFAVPETDPLALAVAVVILGLVAALACYLPARRATRVDPLTVMRSD